jgi:hypothetical protein
MISLLNRGPGFILSERLWNDDDLNNTRENEQNVGYETEEEN